MYNPCVMDGSPEESGVCHKHFRSIKQAEDFIEDWRKTVADLYAEEIKRVLDGGGWPPNMQFNVEALFPAKKTETAAQPVLRCGYAVLR